MPRRSPAGRAVLLGGALLAGTLLAAGSGACRPREHERPSPATEPRSASPGRPDVLFVLVDDLSFRIGLYGGQPPTPNLDRLAARGRRFDRAYVQYPLCSPSRTSLLTGWRPERTRVWGNLGPPREHLQGAVPLQERFAAAGYETVRVGKIYHSRFEDEFRWDQVFDSYDPPSGQALPSDEAPAVWGTSKRSDAEEPDGRAARRAVEILGESRRRPLFLALGFLKPHDPWVVPEAYVRAHPPASVTLPPQPSAPVAGAARGASLDLPRAQWREAAAHYQAAVAFMDAQLGLVLDALDREQRWDRTVVVLAGDNGLHVGEHGLWGKTTLFEESLRVPLLVAAPGLGRAGTPTTALAELVDVYPTLLELCGLTAEPGLDGRSLVPILRDPTAPGRPAAWSMRKVGAARRGQIALSVRTARWRYTEWPDGARELYDHELDPWELQNRAADPALEPVRRELAPLLREAAARLPAESR
jgi:uncharacterized sulfatase